MTKGGPANSSTTLAVWSYREAFGTVAAGLLAGRRGRQHPHRRGADRRIRLSVPAAPGGAVMTAAAALVEDRVRGRDHRRHALPRLLDGQRLAHKDQRHAGRPAALVSRGTPPSTGTSRPCHDQLPALGTSLLLGLGTVVLTLADRHAGRVRAGPAAPTGSQRPLNFLLLVAQMIPAVVMAMGFYAIYLSIGHAQHHLGSDHRGLDPGGALRRAAVQRVHVRDPAGTDAGRAKSTAPVRGAPFPSIVVPLSRNSTITVSLFAFLWAWSDFVFASTLNRNGSTSCRSRWASTPTSATTPPNGTRSWRPRSSPPSPPQSCSLIAQRYVAAGVTAGAVKD